MLDHIREESFYNHTEVDLSEVRGRLRETQELLGGEDALESFVKSGLSLFGCDTEAKVDSTYTFRITASEIDGQDMEAEYKRRRFR